MIEGQRGKIGDKDGAYLVVPQDATQDSTWVPMTSIDTVLENSWIVHRAVRRCLRKTPTFYLHGETEGSSREVGIIFFYLDHCMLDSVAWNPKPNLLR